MELELPDGATVGDALQALARDPQLGDLLERMPLGTAVNREYARADTRLGASDELVLIPPLSGGGDVYVRITEEPLSVDTLTRAVGHSHAVMASISTPVRAVVCTSLVSSTMPWRTSMLARTSTNDSWSGCASGISSPVCLAAWIYDMVKGLERGVEIERVVLLEKTGGRNDWRRSGAAGAGRIERYSACRRRERPALGGICRTARRRSRRTRSDCRRQARYRRAALPLERHRALRAHPHDRRHGLCADRCHTGGDESGDRTRGARHRRGDARGLSTAHAPLDALTRRGRHSRVEPDRQLPGVASEHRAGGRGDRRGAPSRDSPDRWRAASPSKALSEV